MKQLANNIIETLRAQPMVLALIVMNLIFLLAIGYVLREVSQSLERRDALLERCLK